MENQDIQSTTENNSGAAPDLTITDLSNIRAILDVAVRRGTFSASEISGVGAAYDRLNSFLTAVQQQATPDDQKQN
jgi:hypothetical protein